MTTALAIMVAVIAVAGGIAVAVLAWKLADARGDARDSAVVRDAALAANAAHGEKEVRLEQVIVDLKTEIMGLEKDLDACQDPAIVRDRLRRMLASSGGDDSPGALPNATPAV